MYGGAGGDLFSNEMKDGLGLEYLLEESDFQDFVLSRDVVQKVLLTQDYELVVGLEEKLKEIVHQGLFADFQLFGHEKDGEGALRVLFRIQTKLGTVYYLCAEVVFGLPTVVSKNVKFYF